MSEEDHIEADEQEVDEIEERESAEVEYIETLRRAMEALQEGSGGGGVDRVLAMVDELRAELANVQGVASALGEGPRAGSGVAGGSEWDSVGSGVKDGASPLVGNKEVDGDIVRADGAKGGVDGDVRRQANDFTGGGEVSRSMGLDGEFLDGADKLLKILREIGALKADARPEALTNRRSERRGGVSHGFHESGGEGKGGWSHEYLRLLRAGTGGEREGKRGKHVREGGGRGDEGVPARRNGRDAGGVAAAGQIAGHAGGGDSIKELTASVEAMHRDVVNEIRKLPHGEATRFSN